MGKIVIRCVMAAILLPIAIGAAAVYTKQIQEKEQLVLAEVGAFLQGGNNLDKAPRLLLMKPGFFTGYETWKIKYESTNEIYQYKAGEVVKAAAE
jgi:hypothetical protein